jgi:ketosteroid isomerase-like protein
MYPPDMPAMCGSANLAGFLNWARSNGVRSAEVSTTEILGKGDIVSEVGLYNMIDSAGLSIDKGKYIVVWKKENGQWKRHRDIWNSNGAPGM